MYNRQVIVGRLTADPVLKLTSNGISVTSFSVAVNRSYAEKDGTRKADFFDVVAWRGTAEFICKYFKKAQMILIEGETQSRTYVDKQGQNRRVWELIASNARFVGSKNDNKQTAGQFPDNEAPDINIDRDVPEPPSGGTEDFQPMENTDEGDLPF